MIVKGNLEHENLPLQGRSRSIVPCSRDLPGKTQSDLSQNTAWWTRHVGKRDSDRALPWKKYIRSTQKDSPNMIEELTPYQILGKLTSQTEEERDEVCRNEGSRMTGQQLYQKIHPNCQREEPMYIRARQGNSGEMKVISTFSHKKIEK